MCRPATRYLALDTHGRLLSVHGHELTTHGPEAALCAVGTPPPPILCRDYRAMVARSHFPAMTVRIELRGKQLAAMHLCMDNEA
jgi:hypothetical protein